MCVSESVLYIVMTETTRRTTVNSDKENIVYMSYSSVRYGRTESVV